MASVHGSRRRALVAAIALVACDGSAVATDPGRAAPAPPALGPCTGGWTEVVDGDGRTVCTPWPAGGERSDCAPGEAHLPGTSGCARLGAPCAADGWPADLPAGVPIVYVDDDAPGGGDGAGPSSAFSTISDALAVAPAGAVIAIATGRYDDNFVLDGGRALVGACVEGTRLTRALHSDTYPAFELDGAGVGMRDLTIDAPERNALAIVAGADATLESVVITGARVSAVYLVGALHGRRVVIEGTRTSDAGTLGRGVEMHAGSTLVLEDALVRGNHDLGIFASGAGTSVSLTDVAIEDTESVGGTTGHGLTVERGAHATLSRVVIARSARIGLGVDGADTVVDASDVVVEATAGADTPRATAGIAVDGPAALTLARVRVEGAVVGLLAQNGGSVTATDLVVRDVGLDDGGTDGFGVTAHLGSTIRLERALLARTHGAGVVAADAGTSIEASDLEVIDVLSWGDGTAGIGLAAQTGGALRVVRLHVARVRDAALFAGDAATLDASDVLVEDLRPDDAGDFASVGAYAETGSTLTLTRATLRGAIAAGVVGYDHGTLVLEDVQVSDVAVAPCASTTCPDRSAAFGLVVHAGGSLVASQFTVERVGTCGVTVGMPALDGVASSMDLSHGVVADSPVGACVEDGAFDVERLHHDVAFRDVGVPLQAISYALPTLDAAF